ncbi:MAG: hypothetical protein ACLUE2_15440 [Bacteroides cellulosilyticus]
MLQGIAKATLHIIDGLDWNLNLSYQNEQHIYSNYILHSHNFPASLPATVRLHAAPRKTSEADGLTSIMTMCCRQTQAGLMAGYSWEQNDDNDGFGLTVYNFTTIT